MYSISYFVVLVLSALGLYFHNTGIVCPQGSHLHISEEGKETCQLCTDGVNFMPHAWHRFTSCLKCTTIMDSLLEIPMKDCNRFHDAEIYCTHGYYRYKARNVGETDHCRKCSECGHNTTLIPCQDFYDTMCCHGPDYEAALNRDGPYCRKLCQQGQYLDNVTEQCRTCPSGTYMTHVNHSNTACNICQTLPNLQSHQVIPQACNSTHPTIIGCEDGYFRDLVIEQTTREVICLPCRKCHHHQKRACDTYHNTVCCSENHMIVVDTSDGPECRYENNNHTLETNHTLSEGRNDTCTRLKVTNELCWWLITIVSVLPLIVFVIKIFVKHKIFLKIRNIDTKNAVQIKLAMAIVIIALLLIVCLLVVIVAMLFPCDICLWPVLIVLLVYSFISVYLFTRNFLYMCKNGLFLEHLDQDFDHDSIQDFEQDFHHDELNQEHDDAVQHLLQHQDTGSSQEEELDIASVLSLDFSQLKTPMNAAEQKRVYDYLKSAIKQGADINAADDTKKTLLMYAAEHGQVDFLHFLLRRKADVNRRDASGNSALAYAAKNGHDNCVEKLIKSLGAGGINIPNNDGVTALMMAVSSYSSNKDLPNLFINAGADIHIQDNYCNTALVYAVKRGHKEWVRALIKAGADKNINLLNKERVAATMLVVSSYGDDDKLLDILLQAGADVNVRDKIGNNLLALAAKSGSAKCVSALIKAGLKDQVNEQNIKGLTPLMLAVTSSINTSSCPKLLIEAGADIHIKDDNGNSALFDAVKCRNGEYVRVLIDSGANVNDVNNAGNTPLLEAVHTRENTSLCLRLLLKAGADINVIDRDDNTALDLAKKMHNVENEKIIIDWMSGKRSNY